MRILYLADAPYVHTRRWVEHFAALGHDCEVLSFRPGEVAGARVTYVGGGERLGKARYLVHARRVSRLVREARPDVLHALHLTSYGFLGALSGYRPFIASAWGMDVYEAPGVSPFHRWLTRFALGRADLITATGLQLAAETARYAPAGARVEVVSYGVDLELFRSLPREGRGGPVVIGTAGRLSPEKGQRYLLEAFAALNARGGVVLRIAGDGPDRARLERLASRLGVAARVEFSGWLDHERLPGFLQGLDVFALPSLHEGFGVAAVEASAMALPVVASRVQGLPDVVEDGLTGLLVPARDAEALAEALQGLVLDPERRMRMGEAGRAYVAARYDWRENASAMGRLYDEVCRPRAGAAPQ